MGASVIGASGVDKSLCLPFGTLNTPGSTFSATTSYTTVYSGVGSGFLDLAFFLRGSSSTTSFMRVTFDGVVVFEGQCGSASNSMAGMVNRNLTEYAYNGSSMVMFFNAGGMNKVGFNTGNTPVQHPYTANAAGTVPTVWGTDSFYFKNSILVEIKTSSADTVTYYLAGGKTP